ncbi:MAG: TRAP transporter small permease [Rhodospirillales bacterium]|nr:TRAP transporter small permease [Rhodospirillales bacterium]
MTDWLANLDRRGTVAARWFAFLGLIGLVALALITITDVLMRWLFNSPIDGVADVGRLIVAVVIASFFPVAIAERHHVSIGFLGNLVGPQGAAWLDTLAALVTSVFFILLGWQFVLYTIDLQVNGETTWLLGLPVAPWWAAATLFMLLCVPVQIVGFMVLFRAAKNRDGDDDAAPRLLENVLPTDQEY